MKIFQQPSYDRFCLFETERKTTDFRSTHDNFVYKNEQTDNVVISDEGMNALREKLKEIKQIHSISLVKSLLREKEILEKQLLQIRQ